MATLFGKKSGNPEEKGWLLKIKEWRDVVATFLPKINELRKIYAEFKKAPGNIFDSPLRDPSDQGGIKFDVAHDLRVTLRRVTDLYNYYNANPLLALPQYANVKKESTELFNTLTALENEADAIYHEIGEASRNYRMIYFDPKVKPNEIMVEMKRKGTEDGIRMAQHPGSIQPDKTILILAGSKFDKYAKAYSEALQAAIAGQPTGGTRRRKTHKRSHKSRKTHKSRK